MKAKILLFTSSLVLFVTALQAQVDFKISGGGTYSTWRGDATGSMKDMVEATNGILTTHGKAGFYGGISASIPIGGGVSLSPGAFYSQKGYELSGDYKINKMDFVGANASAKVNSQYIDVPLLLKIEPSKGFEIFAGPQVSFLVKSDLKIDAGAMGFSFFKRTMDITNDMNDIDLGLTGGLGYRFANGFSVNATYDHGLSRLDKNENFKAYNQAFEVGIGYSF